MKKRFVSLTLAASLAAVSIAGCGSSDADATTAAHRQQIPLQQQPRNQAAADTTAEQLPERTPH